MNFYVGQQVVAIKDQSQGRFKKGDEFVIIGLKKSCCGLDINVGIKYDYENFNGNIRCASCGRIEKADIYSWHDSTMFAPKQQLSQTTYNEVMMWIEQGNEIAILN